MQNQQLVDYIKQQLQGGVQKDAVRKALLDAGWPQADVDDSMKTAEPASATVGASASAQTAFNPSAAMSVGGGSSALPDVKPFASAKSNLDSFTPASADEEADKPRHSWSRIGMSVMAAVIVILLGALVYVYYSLNGRVTTASGESATITSQLSDMQQQVAKLTNDNAGLTTQVATLTADNQVLSDEALFFSPDKDMAADYTISGMIGSASGVFTLTTAHHILITVKNSKDAKVVSALTPLVGQNASLTGKRKPGVPELTVSAVNGAVLTAPAPASTSTPPAAGTPPPAAPPAP